MNDIPSDVLLTLLEACTEPLLVVRVDSPDWPVVLSNPALDALAGQRDIPGSPFPDVMESMIGREMMREASAALRTVKGATLPVDIGSREYLLTLLPISPDAEGQAAYYGAFLRTAGRQVPLNAGKDALRALATATRRVRDLSGDDPVTGLLNEGAFRKILAHDWSVAAREGGVLGLTAFTVDDFDAYRGVFGRHGADSCLKRVAKVIGRFLKRASDVAARFEGAEGGFFVVLSHGSDQAGLDDFAERIAGSVRSIGLHHPRSGGEKFVTLSYQALTCEPRDTKGSAANALGKLLQGA